MCSIRESQDNEHVSVNGRKTAHLYLMGQRRSEGGCPKLNIDTQGTQNTGDVRRKAQEWDIRVVARVHYYNKPKTCRSAHSERNVYYRKTLLIRCQ